MAGMTATIAKESFSVSLWWIWWWCKYPWFLGMVSWLALADKNNLTEMFTIIVVALIDFIHCLMAFPNSDVICDNMFQPYMLVFVGSCLWFWVRLLFVGWVLDTKDALAISCLYCWCQQWDGLWKCWWHIWLGFINDCLGVLIDIGCHWFSWISLIHQRLHCQVFVVAVLILKQLDTHTFWCRFLSYLVWFWISWVQKWMALLS